MSAPVDVIAVLSATGSVLRSNMRHRNNKARAADTHVEALIKQERAAYLLDQHERMTAAVAELIEALRLSDAWIRETSHQTGIRATATLDRNRQILVRCGGAA